MSSNRKNSRSAYSPNMGTPSAQRKKSSRASLALVLCILLPPIGIAYLWRAGVFRTRGRMLLTAISTLEMAIAFALLLPTAQIISELPVPAVPAAATVAPNDGVVTALSNMDQLLAEQQAAEALLNPTQAPELTDAELVAQHNAEQQAILNTTVYSVFTNAKLYHSREVCGTQSNRRALTVQEAMNEGMGTCPNCDPPVFSGFQ